MDSSRYHSIAKHYIVLHVKFDGGLSMSVLRNRQRFTKKGGSNVYIFKKVQLVKPAVQNYNQRKITATPLVLRILHFRGCRVDEGIQHNGIDRIDSSYILFHMIQYKI
jgi:hypothetical protein